MVNKRPKINKDLHFQRKTKSKYEKEEEEEINSRRYLLRILVFHD
jgi:hypothetical protein